jgi:hypothetical protein
MRRFGVLRLFAGLVAFALTGCVGIAAPVPVATAPGNGATCYAGAYVCPLTTPGPVGATCTCPGLGAPSYGVIN